MSEQELSRREQRKAETRGALIKAGQTLLAERRTAVSIREITALAGVGFGSFFNYFASKEELFDDAAAAAREDIDVVVAAMLASVEDPVEQVAIVCRVTGPMQRRDPDQVKVLLAHGAPTTVERTGVEPHLRQALEACLAAGRCEIDEMDRAVMAVLGAGRGVLQLLDLRPDLDAAAEADQFTVRVLMSLGVAREEATEVVARPLPPIPGREPVAGSSAGEDPGPG